MSNINRNQISTKISCYFKFAGRFVSHTVDRWWHNYCSI